MIDENKGDVVFIEGIIGAGKSTLIKAIKEKLPNAYVVPEPIEIWRNCNGVNVLEAFYKGKPVSRRCRHGRKKGSDMARYTHSFQHLALTTRLKQYVGWKNDGIKISERSHESCRYVFAQMLYDSGKYDPIDWGVYQYEYDFLSTFAPKGRYVFLDTSVDDCVKRMKERARSEEDMVPRDYLEKLHDYHIKWLSQKENVIRLDGGLPFNTDSSIVQEWVGKIFAGA